MSASDDFRVLAIISTFNESDIIGPVLEHLVENGIDTYLIDNHSNDDTVEQARRWLGKGLLEIETFPPDSSEVAHFDWGAILRRKEELATELAADWFIHYDADEIREAPWPGVSLIDAIRWVDILGYNCIDFRVLNFPPIDDGFCQGMDPRSYFRYWEAPSEYDEVQIKAWKSGPAAISLEPFGGHEVQFRDRKVFPIQFLLRHYPIRSQAHGERKVFEERKQRFVDRERAKGWHVQYDALIPGHSFLEDPYDLTLFDRDEICLELLLDNEAARAAEKSLGELDAERAAFQQRAEMAEKRLGELDAERAAFQQRAEAAETHKRGLERQSAYLEGRTIELTRVASRNEAELIELEQRVKSLEAQRIDLEGQLAMSRSSADESSSALRHLEEQNRKIMAALTAIRESTIWRWTAPLRRFISAVKRPMR